MGLLRESRVGGELCASLPWTSARPVIPGAHCEYTRICTRDGVCWQARRREQAATEAHRALHRHELGAGRTTLSFEEWSGQVDTLDTWIDRFAQGLHAAHPAIPFSGA